MGIEPAEHTANRIFDQFLFVDRFDVVGFDLGKHLGEGLQILERNLFAFLQREYAVADRQRQSEQRSAQEPGGCA